MGSYETVVCMRIPGHDGWTQWVGEEAGSSNKLGSARLGHPASHEGAPTVSGYLDSYCPHQCAIWAWNTDTQNWVKDCVRAGWTVAGEYTYPNPMNYETVVCMQIPGHDGWTQWVGEEAGSSNKLGAALTHPASHEGAPTVSGYTDAYCPHQCAIWAWNTDTQNWVKDCVRAGRTGLEKKPAQRTSLALLVLDTLPRMRVLLPLAELWTLTARTNAPFGPGTPLPRTGSRTASGLDGPLLASTPTPTR